MKQCMIFATLIFIFLNSGDDSLRGHDKIVKRKFILDVWKFLFSNGVINRWNSFSIQCANVILLVKKIYVTDRWARTWSRCTGSQLADDYITHSPGGRLSSFSARPAVTFPAAEHHRPLAGTKLCCLVKRHIGVINLPMVVTCYADFGPSMIWTQVQCATALPDTVSTLKNIFQLHCNGNRKREF